MNRAWLMAARLMSHIFVGSFPVISDEGVKGYIQESIRLLHWKGQEWMKWTCFYLQGLLHEFLLLEKK